MTNTRVQRDATHSDLAASQVGLDEVSDALRASREPSIIVEGVLRAAPGEA